MVTRQGKRGGREERGREGGWRRQEVAKACQPFAQNPLPFFPPPLATPFYPCRWLLRQAPLPSRLSVISLCEKYSSIYRGINKRSASSSPPPLSHHDARDLRPVIHVKTGTVSRNPREPGALQFAEGIAGEGVRSNTSAFCAESTLSSRV